MKPTSRGLAPSLNTGHSTFTGARQRLAVALVAIVIAFAGAQTARAQNTCNVKFDISSGGTVEFGGVSVTNGQTIVCNIPYGSALTLTPETGYVVSSVTYDAPDGLSINLFHSDDFHWILYIVQYKGSETPTITVHIVFDKGLAGGADEASAVALTADDDFHLAGGWYKVESDLTLGHTVNLHGDTHITIATGATLTVSTSDEYGISGSALTVSGEGTLNVSASNSAIYVDKYTQTGCAVTLSGDIDGLIAENNVSISGGSLTTSGATYGIRTGKGAITISGGTVSSSGDSAGLFAGDAVSITGGTVSASSNNYGIRGYSVSITGGQVTATSGGIRSLSGDITLGWTSATDYITASGFTLNEGKHVKIADGQTLYGGFPSASFTGTVDDPSALNGLMLRPTAAVTESGTNEYTIRYADGWDAFCDRLAADDGKDFFSGKTVKLGADITVSRMAGASQHEFMGKFDGQGYTLTFTSNENVDGVALFSYVSETTPTGGTEVSHPAIRNLNVVADINTTAQYASALVGRMWGTLTIEGCTVGGTIQTSNKYAAGFIAEQNGNASITDCRSSVTIKSSVEGDGTHGGFVAAVGTGNTLNITGCLFTGKLLTTGATTSCGGFVGYGACNITNSLYAPAAIAQDETEAGTSQSATFARGTASGITIANCYYTRNLNDDTNNTGQGKEAYGAGAAPVGEPIANGTYSVSGITAYANGLMRTVGDATTFYYGGGDNVSVSYVDENGSNASHDATALDETMTTLAAGWYYLGKDINYTQGVSLTSDATIILADGKTMTTSGNSYGIDGSSDGSLTIYGQALGTGTLNATGTTFGIYTDGDVTINGGTVNAIGTNDVGIRSIDGVTINRGTVTTTGIMADNDVTINGGKFTATDDPGICSNDGTVTLGWTSTDDRIRADSYQGTVKIASGKGLYNGSEVLSGTITNMNKLEEETLTPAIVLVDNDDNGDNTTTIATAATACTGDKTLAVQLACRTLYKDGAWNTLCLPFAVSNFTGTPLEGATVKELLTTSNLDNGTLTLNFSDNLTAIEAGKPYIVKWAKADGYDEADPETRDVKNPVFTGVTISNTTPTAVEFSIANSSDKCQFVGQYSLFDITAGNINSIIMLGANNTLGYSKNPRTLRSFRAHFEVPTHTGAPAMNSFVIDFGDESTGISLTPDPSPRGEGSEYYTLDGRKLDGKPTKKGMYIVNGQKVVIK